MFYCEKCRLLTAGKQCHRCGKRRLRLPQNNDTVYLLTKEAIWSDGVEEILNEHNIPCLKQGVFGAGITSVTHLPETYHFFVPFGAYEKAKELLDNFFRT